MDGKIFDGSIPFPSENGGGAPQTDTPASGTDLGGFSSEDAAFGVGTDTNTDTAKNTPTRYSPSPNAEYGSCGNNAFNEYNSPRERKRNSRKKPPARKTLIRFGIITLLLCLVLSTVSGVVASYITVHVINFKEGSDKTTTQGEDELISVTTEPNGDHENDVSVPSAPVVSEQTASESVTASPNEKKTKGEVYAESVNSIVGIKAEGEKEVEALFGRKVKAPFTSTGSGFFISADGYILTNYHVIDNASRITVTTYGGQAYEATVRGYEKSNDIAVLKAEGEFTPVTPGDSSSLAVGDDILVIGNPLGELSYTFTNGVVSYLNRAVTMEEGNAINMFQTNAAINEGNSGGPVFDMYGKAVGIASAKYASASVEGLGFFIPINDIKNMVSDIIEKGYVSGKPSIGVSVQTVTQTMSFRYSVPVGLYIVAVGSDTAAARSGLKAADVIVAIDGVSLSGVAELSSFLSSKRAGDTVTLTVSRSGSRKDISLTLDEYKPSPARTQYTAVYDY